MDVSIWVSLISSMGFPAALCIWLVYYVNKLNTEHITAVTEIFKEHHVEVTELSKSIDKNSAVLEGSMAILSTISNNFKKEQKNDT